MARPAHFGWFCFASVVVIALFLTTLLGVFALAGISQFRLAAGESPPSPWILAGLFIASFGGTFMFILMALREYYQDFLPYGDRLRAYIEELGPLRRHRLYFSIAEKVALHYGAGATLIWTYAITTICCVGLLFISMFGTVDMLIDYATPSAGVCLVLGLGLADLGDTYICAAIPLFVAVILHLVIVYLRTVPVPDAEEFFDAAEEIEPDHTD